MEPLTAADITRHLPYAPNTQQSAVIDALARFCAPLQYTGHPDAVLPDAHRVFILNGYAGTGKTTLTAALVNALAQCNINTVLMAPTGRAAKVLSDYAARPAHTIHRRIYRHSLNGGKPPLRTNNDPPGTLYIVDEASMVGDAATGDNLLADLLMYVYAGTNPRLLLIGDTAQLPPVGAPHSPAMQPDVLRRQGLKVSAATLTRVARQKERSGILANAVNIRRDMQTLPGCLPKIITDYPDVTVTPPADLPEVIETAYATYGPDQTIIITRSNRRAADFNRAIRTQVLYLESVLAKDEPLLIVKNNYHWSRRAHNLDFIANGDILTVDRVIGTEMKHGFEFADVTLRYSGTEDPVEAKIFLETLDSDDAALPSRRLNELYMSLSRQYGLEPRSQALHRALATDPYWNALQAKYAYCLTCHKAQGGQWQHVMVDMTYINPDAIGTEFYRWLYTAVTRARNHLTIIDNPPQDW